MTVVEVDVRQVAAAGGIDVSAVVAKIGANLAAQVRDATLAIYRYAATYAAQRGIIIADTKFEFGTDADGKLYVMDEMLTPDSSRFWPADEYRVGISPPSYDKQFCATISRRCPGTRPRRARTYRPTSSPIRRRSTPRRCASSPAS